MAKPIIEFRGQSRLDKTITVIGKIKGTVTSVTIELPAAAIPNGAVSQPATNVVLNAAGEFSHPFPLLPYGEYDRARIVAENADGTTELFTVPMKLFVPGTAPVGTPRVLLPPYAVPVFNAAKVAQGAEVTSFTVQSTSTVTETDVFFTFGQPFKAGDLAPVDFLVGKIVGEGDVPLQFNVKATWQDGSVRHAIISGKIPILNAGQSKTVSMVRAAAGASSVPLASNNLVQSGTTGVQLSIVIDGITYVAESNGPLTAGGTSVKSWIGGAIANEYIVKADLKLSGTQESHPHLTAQFAIRRYGNTNKYKIDVIVEHSKAYAAVADINYVGKVMINGVEHMNIVKFDGVTPLTHYPCSRWKKTFWLNVSIPVHIKHNFAYACATGMIPNYDPRVVPDEVTLDSYKTILTDSAEKFHLMGTGIWQPVFQAVGGRPDIGLSPSWYAMAVISQDKRAKDLMLALADCSGTFGIHRRDNSTGPGAGYPISVINFPRATEKGTTGDSKNTATGLTEKFPAQSSVTGVRNSGAYQEIDTSHQANFAYYPYLFTGEHFYLEELQFWVSWNISQANPAASGRAAEKGLTVIGQVRAQGWTLRTVGEAAAVTPDDHSMKPVQIWFLQQNLSKFNELYTDNPNANKLGVITASGAVVYDMEVDGVWNKGTQTGFTKTIDTGIGVFQDDFVSQSVGHVAEMGYADAVRFRNWKAKFVINRMIGPGVCWINAASPYSWMVRRSAADPFFETVAEAQQATLSPALRVLPCGSQERVDQLNLEMARPANDIVLNQMMGYSYTTEGFPSNYQPALAMCVDGNAIPNSDLAWSLFDGAAVKPKYDRSPQFAIVPRTVALEPVEPGPEIPPVYVPDDPIPTPPKEPNPVDPVPPVPEDLPPIDTYTGFVGTTLYFGRNS